MSIYSIISEARENPITKEWDWEVENEEDYPISMEILNALMLIALDNKAELPNTFELKTRYVSSKRIEDFLEGIVGIRVRKVKWLDDIGAKDALYQIILNN